MHKMERNEGKYIEGQKIYVGFTAHQFTKGELKPSYRQKGDYEFTLNIHNRDTRHSIPFLINGKFVESVYTSSDQRRDIKLGPEFCLDFMSMKTKEDLVSLIEKFTGEPLLEATQIQKELIKSLKEIA